MSKTLRQTISYTQEDSDFINFIKNQHNASLSIRLLCSKWYQDHKDTSADYLDFLNGTVSSNEPALKQEQPEQPKSTTTDQNDSIFLKPDNLKPDNIFDDFSDL